MPEIKSALEIALERTAGIAGDKETLVANERKNEGKRLASRFLAEDKEADVGKKLKDRSGVEGRHLREGFFETMLANLSLPSGNGYKEKLDRLETGIQFVIKDRRNVSYLLEQIDQFFKQYLETREQVGQQLKQQYEPQLREKERAMAEQLGAQVHLTVESDPDYANLLQKNLAHLEEQYSAALNQVKDEISRLFNSRR